MARDMTQRVTMARVDDASRQGKVYAARRLIYKKQYRINGAAIEDLLKEQSLVPTAVCLLCPSCSLFSLLNQSIECFL
jgi:hypothetical protein